MMSTAAPKPGGAAKGDTKSARDGLQNGNVLEVEVFKVEPTAIKVRLPNGRLGTLGVSQISKERLEDCTKAGLSVGDKIKALVLSASQRTGVRLNTRELEPQPGDMLRNRQAVFAQAEAMAEQYRATGPQRLAARQKAFSTLKVGQLATGHVTGYRSYGVNVRIGECNILLPFWDMPTKLNRGDQVKVLVTALDTERARASVTARFTQNPDGTFTAVASDRSRRQQPRGEGSSSTGESAAGGEQQQQAAAGAAKQQAAEGVTKQQQAAQAEVKVQPAAQAEASKAAAQAESQQQQQQVAAQQAAVDVSQAPAQLKAEEAPQPQAQAQAQAPPKAAESASVSSSEPPKAEAPKQQAAGGSPQAEAPKQAGGPGASASVPGQSETWADLVAKAQQTGKQA